jgi:hypothetical protein
MTITTDAASSADFFAEQRRAALGYVLEAFNEAKLDGIDGDCVAQAALFTALRELIEIYGETAVADFARRLPDRVLSGEFTVQGRHN